MSSGPSESSDSPVVRLRRRLGSLPIIVAKHGPPPEESELPIGRARSKSVNGRDESGMSEELQREIETAKTRRELAEKATKVIKAFEGVIVRCERAVSVEFMVPRRTEAANLTLRVTATASDDPATAIDKLNEIIADAGLAQQSIIGREFKQATAAQKMRTVEEGNTVPAYGGGRTLANTGAKEFKKTVTDRVTAMNDRIATSVKQGRGLTEEEEYAVYALCDDLAKKVAEYDKKAAGINGDKHPHMKQLYVNYGLKANTLASDLKEIAKGAVIEPVREYRAKKQETLVLFAKLDKVVALWSRIDVDELERRQDEVQTMRNNMLEGERIANETKDYAAAKQGLIDLDEEIKEYQKDCFGSKDARNKLDGAVGKIGSKAKNQSDIDFVKEAMKSRFGLDKFEGDLTKTNVIAFYEVFSRVPESHTLKNKRLTSVERTQSLESIESFYTTEGDGGKMVIKAMRTSGPLTVLQNDIIGPALLEGVEGSKRLDQFSWVTLHEIGHAVDATEDFMGRRGGEFGDWKFRSLSDVVKMMTSQLATEKGVPRQFAAAYIQAIQAGVDPATDETVTGAWGRVKRTAGDLPELEVILATPPLQRAQELFLQYHPENWPESIDDVHNELTMLGRSVDRAIRELVNATWAIVLRDHVPAAQAGEQVLRDAEMAAELPDEPDWEDLADATILKWYKNAKLKEPANAVLAAIKMISGGDAWVRAGKFPIGDRNWHQAYDDQWYSYEPAIWEGRVSNYQMRAPGEYFAEAYAAYYLGKLPETARLYKALKELDLKTELASN